MTVTEEAVAEPVIVPISPELVLIDRPDGKPLAALGPRIAAGRTAGLNRQQHAVRNHAVLRPWISHRQRSTRSG